MATNHPIGSQAPDDFKFNVANIDRAMNSDAATFTSRAASDQPAREQFTWAEIQRRAKVEINAAEQAKIDAQAARDDAQAIAGTLAAVKIYRTHALAVADLPNLQDGDNVEINQDETTDWLRTRYVVVSGALADKTILSTVVTATATPVVDTAAWEDAPVLSSTPSTIAAAINTAIQKLAKRTKWLRDFVVLKTSGTGSAHIPSGTSAQRDASPQVGYVRFNTETGQPEIYDGSAWAGFGATGQMFELIPHNGPAETIPVGAIPANGQKWYAATYPDAAEAIEAGNQFVVTEAQWNAGVSGNADAYKGCWSLGGTDGNGRWYRAPKLNRDGAYRAPFLRGSEIGVDAGVITHDRIRNITGTLDGYSIIGSLAGNSPTSAVQAKRGAMNTYSSSNEPGSWGASLDLDASRSVGANHVGPENNPRYHGVIMCIRMFGTVSNPGSVDAAQLATDLGVANAKITALENRQLPLGDNQEYQDCTAARAFNQRYYNTTEQAIEVVVGFNLSNTATLTKLKVAKPGGADVVVSRTAGLAGGSYPYEVRAIVPAGHSYILDGGSPTLLFWRELRNWS